MTAPGFHVTLAEPDDLTGWRDAARVLVRSAVAPERVSWSVAGEGGPDLFAQASHLPEPPADAPDIRVSRAFMELARIVVLHADPGRFDLLYRLVWRLRGRARLIEDRADDDVRAAEALARQVRRDIHKMRAFLRFREVGAGEATHYVAWFEPAHHILRINAGFFVRRFATMTWSILTPQGTLHWDGETLREGPPASRSDAPDGDPVEDLWLAYYAAIFNPARLKIGAMLREMPKRYWKNMPEAALIPDLVASAQSREAAMIGASPEAAQTVRDLPALAEAVEACRRCSIGCNGTHAVAGMGQHDATWMVVGEQPGDREEAAGMPFVGPAGQVLRRHVDLSDAWVTNAVKHFKFTWQGKRRLHQSPTAGEIDTCRWWLDSERGLIRPRVILALGASAARGLLGKTVSAQRERGKAIALDDGSELWITTHPSYLLRLGDSAARASEEARFAADLAQVRARVDSP